MKTNSTYIIVTGSLGLIGYETTLLFLNKGYSVLGIDNDLRGKLFNIKTQYNIKLERLKKHYPQTYMHHADDIRNIVKMKRIFKAFGSNIISIIHTAAQTSHDWARKDPLLDFSVNAQATLSLLELFRTYSPYASFVFCSTNKAYGDLVNKLPLIKAKSRYDLSKNHIYYQGIPESFSIDQSTHSLFGSSKVAADILVQEYGRYFHLNTGIFRLGVIAGEYQSGALEQGFLSHLINEILIRKSFTIIGYGGCQVRDILHARDVAQAFYLYVSNPSKGEVYNLGGGRNNSTSILEVLDYVKKKTSLSIQIKVLKQARAGDHKWWVSDFSKFQKHYPAWKPSIPLYSLVDSIIKYAQSR